MSLGLHQLIQVSNVRWGGPFLCFGTFAGPGIFVPGNGQPASTSIAYVGGSDAIPGAKLPLWSLTTTFSTLTVNPLPVTDLLGGSIHINAAQPGFGVSNCGFIDMSSLASKGGSASVTFSVVNDNYPLQQAGDVGLVTVEDVKEIINTGDEVHYTVVCPNGSFTFQVNVPPDDLSGDTNLILDKAGPQFHRTPSQPQFGAYTIVKVSVDLATGKITLSEAG